MEQEHKNLKPLLLAAVAAVTVVAILLVFFFSGRKSASSQTIVLPEPPAPEQTESEQQPQTSLASVSRENVQSIRFCRWSRSGDSTATRRLPICATASLKSW